MVNTLVILVTPCQEVNTLKEKVVQTNVKEMNGRETKPRNKYE